MSECIPISVYIHKWPGANWEYIRECCKLGLMPGAHKKQTYGSGRTGSRWLIPIDVPPPDPEIFKVARAKWQLMIEEKARTGKEITELPRLCLVQEPVISIKVPKGAMLRIIPVHDGQIVEVLSGSNSRDSHPIDDPTRDRECSPHNPVAMGALSSQARERKTGITAPDGSGGDANSAGAENRMTRGDLAAAREGPGREG